MLWLLGALGLTGVGIGVAALLGSGPWMLMAGKGVLAFLGRLNIWQLLLIAALLIAGVQTLRLKMEQHHSGALQTQLNSRIAADKALTQHALQVKRSVDELTGKISTLIRSTTDAQNRAIAADAGALRVSGPGKAVCPRLPGTSGNGARPAKPDAAGPALPPDDSAAVPWGWLTDRAEEHDQLLAEVQAWRTWHDEVLKVWPKK